MWKAAIVVVIVALVGAWAWWGTVSEWSLQVCEECGLRRTSVRWLGMRSLEWNEDQETAVSKLLEKCGAVRGHAHCFVGFSYFEQGLLWGARGCGDGSAAMNAVSARAAVLLRGLYEFGDHGVAEKLRRALLGSGTARAAGRALDHVDVPLENFAGVEEFKRWWAEHGDELERK